jgi:uncharacterized protein (TIGR02271 family)
MDMTSVHEHLSSLRGADVYDRDGDKIGSIGQLYTDASGQPTWASVQTGLFGLRESLVPIYQAQWSGDRLQVPYDKKTVKDAPNVDVDPDEPLHGDEIRRLYEYYNLGRGNGGTQEGTQTYRTGTEHGGEQAREGYGSQGYESQGYESQGTDRDAMTRSEEQLHVGTEREAVGQARLRKYVVTENVQTTVPVQREEVRVEREPITDANRDRAFSGSAITESEHEVTLHAERPVVNKEAVPVERVRMGTETVTDHETVGGEVRKEQIEADLPHERGTRNIG